MSRSAGGDALGEIVAVDISAIVLTQDEELNIESCLASVAGWVVDTFVVDSGSTDRTCELARACGAKVYHHTWSHIADQRNWALENLPLRSEWVLFVDADEAVSAALRDEIEAATRPADVAGFAVRHEFHFLGRPLRHVHTGSAMIRLVRRSRARWQRTEGTDERCVVDGEVRSLTSRLVHCDRKGLSRWVAKHDWYATERAKDIVARSSAWLPLERNQRTDLQFHWRARVRWFLRRRIPANLRPFAYFIYSYIVNRGFLDGHAGFAYAFLHELWFYLLVNWKVREMRMQQQSAPSMASNGKQAKRADGHPDGSAEGEIVMADIGQVAKGSILRDLKGPANRMTTASDGVRPGDSGGE